MNLLAAPLDGEALRALLPHRGAALLVDGVQALHAPPRAELHAHYLVGPQHPVLEGHVPGHPIWPGVLTIEGLAQSCALLAGLSARFPAFGVLLGDMRRPPGEPGLPGLLADVQVRLTGVVRPGDRLDYRVRLQGGFGAVTRFDASASVGRRVVARGSLAASLRPPLADSD